MDASPAADAPTTGSESGLIDFCTRLLGDPQLQAELGPIFDPAAFVSAAASCARSLGYEVDPDALTARLRPDPLGLSRWGPAPVTLGGWPLRGWLPARTIETGGVPAFDWAWFGEAPLRDSFFETPVRRAAALPLSMLLRTRTSLDALYAGVLPDEVVAPSGFIFHMSRCGSTLAAQMLAAVPEHIVLSEPGPLDGLLNWLGTSGLPIETQAIALRALVSALGRRRSGAERRLFIKTDSWHVLALPLFRVAFPDVPWIFLYRDPVEVMVSQTRSRGVQTVPGGLPEHIFGIASDEPMSVERHCALVLERTCAAAIEHWPLGGGRLVNYAELPEAMLSSIPKHFGFVPDAREREAMASASATDAKSIGVRFVPDSAEKRAAASSEILAETAALREVYGQLEAVRALQEPAT